MISMKLINNQLRDKIYSDVSDKVLKHAPFHSSVHKQITKNFGWWGDDGLFRVKIDNPRWHIRGNLDETN